MLLRVYHCDFQGLLLPLGTMSSVHYSSISNTLTILPFTESKRYEQDSMVSNLEGGLWPGDEEEGGRIGEIRWRRRVWPGLVDIALQHPFGSSLKKPAQWHVNNEILDAVKIHVKSTGTHSDGS
jgi:hypothetical protein